MSVREGMLSKMHLIVRPQMRHIVGDLLARNRLMGCCTPEVNTRRRCRRRCSRDVKLIKFRQ